MYIYIYKKDIYSGHPANVQHPLGAPTKTTNIPSKIDVVPEIGN